MKLSEKIQQLRKDKGYTQEELAELCKVLSRIFGVSVDVLVKDELTVGDVREVRSCGQKAIEESTPAIYEGLLIKESIDDENILDLMEINKVELWKTNDRPKYWTALTFTSRCPDFPERISRTMISREEPGGNWFVDFKAGNVKYIVFRDLVLKYTIGNEAEKRAVCDKCRELGIPDAQMQWAE